MTAQAKLGAIYQNGGFQLVNSASVTADVAPKLDVGGSVDLYMPINYKAKLYGIGGFDTAVGPFAHLDVNLSRSEWLILTGGLRGSITPLIEAFGLGASHTFGPTDFISRKLWSLTTTPSPSLPPPGTTTPPPVFTTTPPVFTTTTTPRGI